jgi:hypothetical protein
MIAGTYLAGFKLKLSFVTFGRFDQEHMAGGLRLLPR